MWQLDCVGRIRCQPEVPVRAVLPTLVVVTAGVFVGCAPKPAPAPTSVTAPPGTTAPADDPRAVAKERLRQIGVALQIFHDATGQLPGRRAPFPGDMSWRVQLLPYLEQENLYRQYKADEPWDSEHNKKFISRMPTVFESPGKTTKAGETHIRSFFGKDAFLPLPPANPMSRSPGRKVPDSFLDGTTFTLAVAEAVEPVVWTRPDDLPFDGKTVPKLGGVFPDGFHGLMANGSVIFFPAKLTTDDLIRGTLTLSGGEVLDLKEILKANGR
jgi:hypothetical protein